MKLEDQVCSVELAKRFKELGVKQGSYFHWISPEFSEGFHLYHFDEWEDAARQKYETYSAFTVAELGEMLPTSICNGIFKPICVKNSRGLWWFSYSDESGKHKKYSVKEQKEADARAKCLLYLIENKLWTVEIGKT